jgi:uncharacterized protein YbaR (Trm112 family)
MTCKARQVSDQMVCNQCGLLWDVNDAEPPVCKTPLTYTDKQARKQLARIREVLRNDNI